MKITFVGAGNMGGAIVKGLIKSGTTPSDISIVEKNEELLKNFKNLGCRIGDLEYADYIVVAVKPWQIAEVAQAAKYAKCVVSIVAGVDCEELEKIFDTKNIVRVMPNTPVEFLEGATFICGNNEHVVKVAALFERVGKSFVVQEPLLEGGKALASCGIAYALRYARASQVGGIELGVNPKLAQQIIAQTLRGAAVMLETGNHPETEIDKVTTPGGITIKGLNAMEKAGFTNAVIEGIKNSK